jgi:hypothetical protein
MIIENVRLYLHLDPSCKELSQFKIHRPIKHLHGCHNVHKKYHPPANKPSPMFASSTVFREAAAPVDATMLCVALADPEVADPELREAVPEAAEEEEANDTRSVYGSGWVERFETYLFWIDWKRHQRRQRRRLQKMPSRTTA